MERKRQTQRAKKTKASLPLSSLLQCSSLNGNAKIKAPSLTAAAATCARHSLLPFCRVNFTSQSFVSDCWAAQAPRLVARQLSRPPLRCSGYFTMAACASLQAGT